VPPSGLLLKRYARGRCDVSKDCERSIGSHSVQLRLQVSDHFQGSLKSFELTVSFENLSHPRDVVIHSPHPLQATPHGVRERSHRGLTCRLVAVRREARSSWLP
jgi:hypothetical protein